MPPVARARTLFQIGVVLTIVCVIVNVLASYPIADQLGLTGEYGNDENFVIDHCRHIVEYPDSIWCRLDLHVHCAEGIAARTRLRQ